MKNKHYNINLNPKKLSAQDLRKHKDFDALLQNYYTASQPKKPSYIKLMYYFAGGIAAALLIGFLLYSGVFASQEMTTREYLATQPYINPPIENIKPDYENTLVNVEKGGEYTYKSGSKIIIPPAAFVYANGETVNGEVSIKYREFHDFVDFFVAGIPMEYDSAGIDYVLESAGMIEIFAEQNGIRLNVAPGKKINVELVSEIMVPATERGKVPSFNIYKLDEGDRNWVYKGKDNIEVIEDDFIEMFADGENSPGNQLKQELSRIKRKAAAELAAIEGSIPRPPAPVKPERANGNDYVFNFDFSDETFGPRNRQNGSNTHEEIHQLRKQYANTLWQVAPGNKDFNEEQVSQIAWEDMKLEQINARDYQLTLINPGKEINVIVNPVLSSKDYETALNEFNQEFEAHQQKIAEREEALRVQKEELEKRIRLERQVANKSYEEQLAIYRENNRDDLATELMIKQKVINRFAASSFGTWNCDRPLPPAAHRLKGQFVDNKSKKFNQELAYLVDKNKNTVYRFYTKDKADVLYNKNSENLIWIVTHENKLAVFPPDKFKNIDKNNDDYTFVMNLVDQQIASEDDVRRILQF